ncbi:hypothetical protein LCGC14_3152300 [marine sediment metagenome]|uniref:Uncharacterized protein n=1 Tax=marine sediment metagenome TaxID=412755 RepID=A0A0F8WHR7_9ZZZZ
MNHFKSNRFLFGTLGNIMPGIGAYMFEDISDFKFACICAVIIFTNVAYIFKGGRIDHQKKDQTSPLSQESPPLPQISSRTNPSPAEPAVL